MSRFPNFIFLSLRIASMTETRELDRAYTVEVNKVAELYNTDKLVEFL